MSLKNIFVVLSVLISLLAAANVVFASTTNGAIDLSKKYAWSGAIGWINFGCEHCNVQITDTAVTGYAWSDNYGWINLSPTDSTCTESVNCGVKNTGSGVLSGSAWGENLGWIDFSGAVIGSDGSFLHAATGNSITGSILFDSCGTNCSVKTDWNPASSRNPVVPNNGGGGIFYAKPAAPAGGFKVLINDGSLKTNNPVVKLTLSGGPDATEVQISADSNFTGTPLEVYQTAKTFILPLGDGQKNIYVRFFSKDMQSSPVISAGILLKATLPILIVNPVNPSYKDDENVIVSGRSNPGLDVVLFCDGKYGMATADENGIWSVNLGTLAQGSHVVGVSVTDDFYNSRNATVNVMVSGFPKVEPVKPENISQQLQITINSIKQKIWSQILSAIKKKEVDKMVTIPKETPEVLKHRWNLLPASLIIKQ